MSDVPVVTDAELLDEWKKPEPVAALVVPVASPAPVAVPTKADRHGSLIRRQDDRIRAKATGIASAALLAADLNDDGSPVDPGTKTDARGKPEGWTHRQYRVARDARQPMKVAPGYLGMAQRILESYQRAEKDRAPSPTLNGDIQVSVRQEFAQYVTVNVTERDPK